LRLELGLKNADKFSMKTWNRFGMFIGLSLLTAALSGCAFEANIDTFGENFVNNSSRGGEFVTGASQGVTTSSGAYRVHGHVGSPSSEMLLKTSSNNYQVLMSAQGVYISQ